MSIIKLDGFEEAYLGCLERFGLHHPIALYDKQKVIEIIMRDGGTYEEALEHFYYNVIGGWFGDSTPAFLDRECLDYEVQ